MPMECLASRTGGAAIPLLSATMCAIARPAGIGPRYLLTVDRQRWSIAWSRAVVICGTTHLVRYVPVRAGWKTSCTRLIRFLFGLLRWCVGRPDSHAPAFQSQLCAGGLWRHQVPVVEKHGSVLEVPWHPTHQRQRAQPRGPRMGVVPEEAVLPEGCPRRHRSPSLHGRILRGCRRVRVCLACSFSRSNYRVLRGISQS